MKITSGKEMMDLAQRAMAGDAAARVECERILGHEVRSLADLHEIMKRGYALLSPGECSADRVQTEAELRDITAHARRN